MTTVSMSAVWDRTTEFLGEHFGAMAGIAALTIFVPAAISDILTPLGAAAGVGLKVGLGVLALAFLILSLWGQLAITALALDPAAGDARGRAIRRLGALILVMLALGVIALVAALPVLALMMMNGVDFTQVQQTGAMPTMTPGVAGMIGLYVLIAIPVALWVMARIAVLPTAVVVAENLSLGALGRSFRLTRGLALKIIGVLLLYAIVTWVATLAVETVVGSILRLVLDGDGPITAASVITAIATALVSTIFSVIGTVFAAKLYLAARAREAATLA